MSYHKNNFQPGDKLYASQMNAIEDQIVENEQNIINNGLTTNIKNALLNIFRNVAYKDDNGSFYYHALGIALNMIQLTGVEAVFTQSKTILDSDSLDTLKSDLIVNAIYSDGLSEIVQSTDYVLSGILSTGTSVITVSYGGQTDTFNVTVTASQVTLSGITCTFDKGLNKIYETDLLSSLKQYLTVTAQWSDGTSNTVASEDYSLTGTLNAGTTSNIVVTYSEKTTSFNVDVDALMYKWDYTKSLNDEIRGAETYLTSDGNNPVPERTENGLIFNAPTQVATFINERSGLDHLDMSVEIDVASFDFAGDNTKHVRFFMDQRGDGSNSVGTGPVIFRKEYGWTSYGYADAEHTEAGYRIWSSTGWNSLYNVNQINAFNGKTVKVYYGQDGHTRKLYLNNTLIGTMTDVYFAQPTLRLRLGGGTTYAASSGDQCYNMVISGIRIYRGEV